MIGYVRNCWYFIALFIFSVHCKQPEIQKNFINDNIHRNIDLSSHIVRENRAIAILPAEGKKLASDSDYYIAVEVVGNQSIAFISAKLKVDKHEKSLKLSKVEGTIEKNGREYEFWKASIAEPSQRNVIIVDISYLNALVPFPREIAQNERHLTEFFSNVYMPSPYATKKQKLKLTLASASVITFTQQPEPVAKSGKTITYGPYENTVEPFTLQPLYVHSENNSPFLTVMSLSRQLWISHWGSNLAIEEWYATKNSAAKLKGQFSRIDFTQNTMNHGRTPVVKSFSVTLPEHVSEPYYRDDVGNVSTSNFKTQRGASYLDLRPRFPLFGGWIYTWHHGYNLPLADFVRVSAAGKFVLQAPFTQSMSNAPIQDFELRIVFPEGSSDIEVEIPFKVDSKHWETTYTFVDSVGRPTLVVRKANVVDEHAVPFQVKYNYGSENNFRKPLVLSAGYLLIFLLSMIYWRVDISFKQHKLKDKKQI